MLVLECLGGSEQFVKEREGLECTDIKLCDSVSFSFYFLLNF